MEEYDDCMSKPRHTKLCKRGYCSAKATFDVYPSAYANIHASKVCKGNIADFEGNRMEGDPEENKDMTSMVSKASKLPMNDMEHMVSTVSIAPITPMVSTISNVSKVSMAPMVSKVSNVSKVSMAPMVSKVSMTPMVSTVSNVSKVSPIPTMSKVSPIPTMSKVSPIPTMTKVSMKSTNDQEESELKRWLNEKWVNVCEPKPYPPCGRKNTKEGKYPYCRPSIRINDKTPMTVDEIPEEKLEEMCYWKNVLPEGVDKKPTRLLLTDEVKYNDLRTLRVVDLREICKQRNLKGFWQMNKQQLIDILSNN